MTISEAHYQAAHQTAVFTDRSNLGMLKFSGETRLDLINRMSTQAVNGLQSGEGKATILTNEIGRIIDRLILYTSSDTVYALTSENNADPIARYLMRFVFFNDDFQIQDISDDTAIFGVYGPQAHTLLVQAGFPQGVLPRHHWRQVDINGLTVYLHKTDPIAGDGFFVMSQLANKTAVQQLLQESGIVEINETAFDALRIESGLPRFGTELSGEYIPLETGLWDDVSFSKGCYIGQEIIARMESRGRLAKKMVLLQLETVVSPPIDLMANNKKAGVLTSVAQLPHKIIGLGYVKTAVLAANSELLKIGPSSVSVLDTEGESTNGD